jgi:hypothetical protein
MSELCVVHLVRRHNGIEPFERFLQAYRAYPGGVPHDLVLLCKGFGSDAQLRPYIELVRDVPYRLLRISDVGLDIWAYFRAARALNCAYLCLLNSYSRPLAPEWLGKLWVHAQREDVGAVGATGSFQSFHSLHLQVTAPGRDASLAGKISHAWRLLRSESDPRVLRRRLLSIPLRLLGLYDPVRDYPAFPNPHLRTNGFVIPRALMLRLEGGRVLTKNAAFRFESGVKSMTNQLLRMGKRVLIVGRDGRAFEPAQWPQSGTYRLGDQSNLLIADNQTDAYARADQPTRSQLSAYAWGNTVPA